MSSLNNSSSSDAHSFSKLVSPPASKRIDNGGDDGEEEEEEEDSVSSIFMDASVQALDDVPQQGHEGEDDDNETEKEWLTNRRYSILFTVVVIVAFGFGFACSVIGKSFSSRRAPKLPATHAPTPAPTPAPSAPLDHRGPVFEAFLRDTLHLHEYSDIFVQDVTTTTNASSKSHQEQALEWLLWEDTEFVGRNYSPLLPSRDRVLQRYALAVFHFATGHWQNRLGGWATFGGAHVHECLWPGVFCHDDDEGKNDERNTVVRAIEIDPFLGILNGTLPTEIGHFSRLERLFLSDNYITGTIPSTLYTLSNLQVLRLSKTDIASTLSRDIGNLENLAYLDLSFSYLYGSIPTELGLCTKLRGLHLEVTDVQGRIPSELGSLTILENLYLDSTRLTGSVAREICNLTESNGGRFLDDIVVDCSIRCDCCTSCD